MSLSFSFSISFPSIDLRRRDLGIRLLHPSREVPETRSRIEVCVRVVGARIELWKMVDWVWGLGFEFVDLGGWVGREVGMSWWVGGWGVGWREDGRW